MKKKFICGFLTAVLLLTAILPMVSCAPMFIFMEDPDRALAMLSFSEDRMNKVSSYTMSSNSTISFDLGSVFMKYGSTVDTVFHSKLFGDPSLLMISKNTTEQTVEDKTTASESSSKQGFIDGKMFYINKPESKDYVLWSSVTATEYIDHVNSTNASSPLFELNSDNCKNASVTENEDGTYTAEYSDFTNEKMAEFNEMFGGIDEALSELFEVYDYKMTVNYSSEFYVTNISVVAVFERCEGISDTLEEPTATASIEYSKLNSTEKPALPEELEGTKESFDVRVIEKLFADLDKVLSYNSARFYVYSYQFLSYYNSRISEEDDVTFENKNGELSYSITAETPDEVYDISYADGIKTIKDDDGDETSAPSENEEEVKFIDQLLLPFSFSVSDVKDIETDEKTGNYKIVLAVDNAFLMSWVSGATSAWDGVATIKPTYNEDGELVKYEYRLEGTVHAPRTGSMELLVIYRIEIFEHS